MTVRREGQCTVREASAAGLSNRLRRTTRGVVMTAMRAHRMYEWAIRSLIEVKHMHRVLPMLVGSVVLTTASFATDDPKLVAEAKIKETEARATALGQVKNGTVKSEELEREHGHLIYSSDIEVPGKSGIDEVNVDAMTGKVIARTHEGPKAERKEAE